ncbi:MAG: nuclear transport factor 2 family protein [Saccharospirillum sp.]|nr:nuclear transport factor 2 family protein [Saccharospirillum sp.]
MLKENEANQGEAGIAEDTLLRTIEKFNVEYCLALDEGRLYDWANFFTQDCRYIILSRENFDAGLPVGLVYCEGRPMLEDRATAILETSMFAPRYLRHFVTNTFVHYKEGDEIHSGSNYLLTQVLMDKPNATMHQIGRYVDRFVHEEGVLKLKERQCIYDNLLLENSLVYPV